MNNWCTCWFFTHILLGILIFKGLTAQRLYKSFGVKGLNKTSRKEDRERTVVEFAGFCGYIKRFVAKWNRENSAS
jgi:hypothetical protein